MSKTIHKYMPRLHNYLPNGISSMGDILKWVKKHDHYDVYSFDIFDTLVRRRIDPPELIKDLVAEHISELLSNSGTTISQEDILATRHRVEEVLQNEAVSKGQDPDCALDEVLSRTLRAVGKNDVFTIRDIIEYEISLEKKASEPMPGVLSVLAHIKSIGKRIICTSDSYLSPSQMSSILENHGLLTHVDSLYISSDLGKRKSTGKLFQHIVQKEGNNIVHIGDNYVSDSIVPREFGIQALWFHSRHEQERKRTLRVLLNNENKMNYVNYVIRGADKAESELCRIGYDIVGPALTVFVHNVVELARKDNVEAVFFIARDGYAMKKIYEILLNDIYIKDRLPAGKYLCLSRLSIKLALLEKLSYTEFFEVCEYMQRFGKKSIALMDILSSYELRPSSFSSIAAQYGINIDKSIDYSSQEQALRELLKCKEFQDLFKEERDRARLLLRGYLASVGFLGKRKVAIVDANVEGNTQSLLGRAFLNDKDYPEVYGYYFNLINLNIRRSGIKLNSLRIKGLVSDWRNNAAIEQRAFMLLGLLIELFAHPNHGVTVGYKNVNGKTKPVFRRTSQESQYRITYPGLQGILAYARDYGTNYKLHNYSCEELLGYEKENIVRWVGSPPKKDVKALKDLFLTGDWPYEFDYSFMKQVKLKDMITIKSFLDKVTSSGWPEGTLSLIAVPGLKWLFYKTGKVKKLRTVS